MGGSYDRFWAMTQSPLSLIFHLAGMAEPRSVGACRVWMTFLALGYGHAPVLALPADVLLMRDELQVLGVNAPAVMA